MLTEYGKLLTCIRHVLQERGPFREMDGVLFRSWAESGACFAEVRSLVNASLAPSRAPAHDSFIHPRRFIPAQSIFCQVGARRYIAFAFAYLPKLRRTNTNRG